MRPGNRLSAVYSRRRACGAYMIELILALAAASVLATAVVGNMAETERFSTAGQNQLLAAAIGQEIIDNARNIRFEKLQALVPGSPYTLLVNRSEASQMGPTLVRRPLLLDQVALEWSQPAMANKFHGTVTCSIGPDQMYIDMLRVTVVVSWSEANYSQDYTLETLIAEQGIHN